MSWESAPSIRCGVARPQAGAGRGRGGWRLLRSSGRCRERRGVANARRTRHGPGHVVQWGCVNDMHATARDWWSSRRQQDQDQDEIDLEDFERSVVETVLQAADGTAESASACFCLRSLARTAIIASASSRVAARRGAQSTDRSEGAGRMGTYQRETPKEKRASETPTALWPYVVACLLLFFLLSPSLDSSRRYYVRMYWLLWAAAGWRCCDAKKTSCYY